MDFKTFMNQEQPVNRWKIAKVAIASCFAGCLLGISVALIGIVG